MKEESLKSQTRSSLLIMLFTMVSRLLGFLREAIINTYFGAYGAGDAIRFALNIPNNLRKLMAEGALSSAFIPELSRNMIDDNTGAKARVLSQRIIAFQLLILVPLIIGAIIFSEPLINLLSSFEDKETIFLTNTLFRALMPYLFFISISAIVMAVLNSNNHFTMPAMSPIIYTVAVISSVVGFHEKLGIYSIVLGVLAGGFLQLLVQLPAFFKLGYTVKPLFRFQDNSFAHVLQGWFPIMLTSGIFVVLQMVAQKFASGLEAGSVSAMNNSIIFWQLPYGIFFAGITNVLFPRMSREFARNDRENLKRTLSYGLRLFFSLMLPATITYLFFGKQMISVTFQGGLFDAGNTALTFSALTGYALGLFPAAAYMFLQRYFYSTHNFTIPFYSAIIVLIVDIFFTVTLIGTFKVQALGLANTMAFFAGFLFLAFFVYKKIGFEDIGTNIFEALKVCICVIPMILFLIFFTNLTDHILMQGRSLRGFALGAMGGLIAWGLLGLMFFIMRVEIVRFIKRQQ